MMVLVCSNEVACFLFMLTLTPTITRHDVTFMSQQEHTGEPCTLPVI